MCNVARVAVLVQVSVEEPMTASSRVSLTITRSGSYGLAVVMWLVTPQSADITDVGATTGSVSIPDGANSAQLEVDILPDDLPEVEELFVVTLVTTNQDSQRIQPDQVCVYINVHVHLSYIKHASILRYSQSCQWRIQGDIQGSKGTLLLLRMLELIFSNLQ